MRELEERLGGARLAPSPSPHQSDRQSVLASRTHSIPPSQNMRAMSPETKLSTGKLYLRQGRILDLQGWSRQPMRQKQVSEFIRWLRTRAGGLTVPPTSQEHKLLRPHQRFRTQDSLPLPECVQRLERTARDMCPRDRKPCGVPRFSAARRLHLAVHRVLQGTTTTPLLPDNPLTKEGPIQGR